MASRQRTKRHDPMAGRVAKLVRGRPWLGWRHRRSMEDYTAARKRNALIQVALNGTMSVVYVVTGQFMIVPVMGLFTYQMGRNYVRLSKDSSGFQAEWQLIREALAESDEARGRGVGVRLPSHRSLAMLPLAVILFVLQFRLYIKAGPWGLWLAAALLVGIASDLVDIALHRRHARTHDAAATLPIEVINLVVAADANGNSAPRVEGDSEGIFPIADYDRLTVSQVLPLLPKLYRDELPRIEERERAGKARRTILQRLARLDAVLADAGEDVTAEEWVAVSRDARASARVMSAVPKG